MSIEKVLTSIPHESWNYIFNTIHKKKYFQILQQHLEQEYSKHTIFPPKEQIFNAFKICNYDMIKVIIIGQDPYINPGQANGLAFSVNENKSIPKSLQNIFYEIKEEYGDVDEKNGDLTRWAKQGVLLLNNVLTVRAYTPQSHFNIGWEEFTNDIIHYISSTKKNIVYMLWGKYAQEKEKYIDTQNNYILRSAHPSPLSAYRGFFGNKHFIKTNVFIQNKGFKTIKWK